MPEGVQPAYERDDARAESAVDLSELLLPGGKLPRPDEARSFAVAYSNEAFDGWLRQPAPVCAAASTAGAWNAAAGQGRTGKTSASVDAIMRLLIEISQDHLRDREGTLQRLLLLPVGAVKEAVDARLSSSGRSLAGKKRQGTTPKLCNTMLKVLCAERVLKQEDSPLKDGDGMPTDVFASLADVWAMTEDSAREILQKEEDRLEQERAADSGSGKTPNRSPRSAPPQGTPSSSTPVEPQDDDDDDEIAQEEDEEEEEGGEKKPKPKGKKRKESGAKPADKVQKPLDQLVNEALSSFWSASITLAKLSRDEVPSTSGVGNWGLLEAAPRMGEFLGSSLSAQARLFMGKSGAVTVQLKNDDSAAEVGKQWGALWSAFTTKRSALVFHLTNHYAMIYALRQWQEPDGTLVRQLLTARRGQRPAAWINFSDARSVMLKWAGYKIMQLTTEEGAGDTPEAEA
eukprot:Hpha_TRINITY_DN16349_c4_g1::TRINITY_DN16349_c4_g1_i1::g.61408::m.61408